MRLTLILAHHVPVVCPVEAWVSCSKVVSVRTTTSVGADPDENPTRRNRANNANMMPVDQTVAVVALPNLSNFP